MDRRNAKITAIAIAATAITGTFAFAAVGGMSILGFGSVRAPAGAAPVQVVADTGPPQADKPVASVPVGSPGTPITLPGADAPVGPGGKTSSVNPVGDGPSGAFVPPVATPTATTAPSSKTPTSVASTNQPNVPPTTAAVTPTTAPPTTAAATLTTVRPAGVPADWPAGKPIPPMPVGCKQPQLEDNGVWNCQN